MRAIKLSVFFALSLVLNSFDLFIVSPAYAGCCMCGTCDGSCTCPGVGRCAWCAAPVSKDLQVNSTFSDRSLESTALSEAVPSVAANSYGTERLIRRIGTSQCARDNFRLKHILGSDNVLKVDPVKDYPKEDNTVALNIA